MRPYIILILSGLLLAQESRATSGSATIVVLRGTAKTADGKTLSEKQKVDPGTTVITGARSFVRLLFSDNTQLNVGPDTTMKIEATKAGEASLVDLVGGQIRAKVTKDPLMKDANGPVKEKMVIKTKTAAMGIRGTDFNVSFNQLNNNTALITFEGNVVMAKLAALGMSPLAALREPTGVQSVGAGQFSGVQPDMPQASIPVKISPAQLETLKGNADFSGFGEKGKKEAAMGSPVPPGVDPMGFSSGSEKSLKEAVAKAVGGEKLDTMVSEAKKEAGISAAKAPPPEGFLNKSTGEYAPRAGGFIDLSSGRYVPPPAGSAFDPNTGTFTPPKALGSVDPATGMYNPPKGVNLDPVKGFVAEAKPTTAPDGARIPSGAGPEAPPPPAVMALVAAMNTMTSPEASTQKVTLDNSLNNAAGNGSFTGTAPPPPPPPGSLPPPPPPGTDPQTDRPLSFNCGATICPPDVATTPPPTSTGVKFSINVTD